MTRSDYLLPELKSRWTTLERLLQVRDGKVWCLKQSESVYRICTRPPSCEVLTRKLDGYLAGLNLPPSGINIEKEKFPDRKWLILAIATLSKGGDEIFKRDYVPPIDQLRKVVPAQVLVRNDDGLLDVPLALLDKRGKRALRMATLDKASKLEAKLMLIQNRNLRQFEQEANLIKEIEKVKLKQELKAKGMDSAMIEIEETKQQNFTTMKLQAQEFIDQELMKRDAERAAHMEQEIERRLAEAL